MPVLLLVVLLSALCFADSAGRSRQILSEAAQGKEGDQRKEVAAALGLVPPSDRAAALVDSLVADKDYQVRIAALESAGEFGDRQRAQALRAALADPVPEVSFAAARQLAEWNDPQGLDALAAVFSGEQKASSGFFKKEMMDSWRKLRSPRSAVLFSLRRGIGFVPVPGLGAGYGAFANMLGDADFSARAVSYLALCQHKAKECGAMTSAALRDEDWAVRAAALHLLAQRRRPGDAALVEPLLEDKKARVQILAAATYLRLVGGAKAQRGRAGKK